MYMRCADCCQVAGRSLCSPVNNSTDNNGRAAPLDPVRLAKLRAANEIVKASWQYKVGALGEAHPLLAAYLLAA